MKLVAEQSKDLTVPPKRSSWKSFGGGSLMVSVVVHGGLLAVFGLIVWKVIPIESESPVEFIPVRSGGGAPAVSTRRVRAVSPLNSSESRVSALGVESIIELPLIDEGVSALSSLPSLGGAGGGGFGSGSGAGLGDGRGVGTGQGGAFDGATLSGKALFFEQKVAADRVVYVIDYSGSMNGERSRLMRSELSKSVLGLSPLMRFQLIFFAGPTWIAGDEVTMIKDHDDDKAPRSAEVIANGRTYQWENKGHGVWEPNRRLPKPEWRMVDTSSIATAVGQIKKTPFKYGGYWVSPLELALSMDPPPDAIYFMTDGASSDNTQEAMRDVIRHAKSRKTVINTIAMMEPAAEEGMKALADATGGQFTIVEKGGKVTVVSYD